MSQDTWTAVDQYITQLLVQPDEANNAALRDSQSAGLPAINVSPPQGKMLMLLAMSMRARSILEIGTLGAYSTIYLARGMQPGGKLITLEAVPKHAEVARRNIERAGLSDRVELLLGDAADSLAKLVNENRGPFDLIFIDADKVSYSIYLDWALKLSHSGTLIIADNTVRKGAVIEATSKDESVLAVRQYNELVAKNPRLTATSMQVVGQKGYDGFTMAIVK